MKTTLESVQVNVAEGQYQVITFYSFKDMGGAGTLPWVREALQSAMLEFSVKGTVILATEGFNATVSGLPARLNGFIPRAQEILDVKFEYKISFYEKVPFRRAEVKIKPEIVTLKKKVDVGLGMGTHVDPRGWNSIIRDPDTLVIDTRNDYEYRTGTFRRAVNPQTAKFSELPEFVANNLDPKVHRRVALFCTGGIRCEKFTPYMKSLGFDEVYQLEGGILKYLEEIPANESLWEGECFVFDDRVTVDHNLKKGERDDFSQNVRCRKA